MVLFQNWFRRTAATHGTVDSEPQPDAYWWDLMQAGNAALSSGCTSQAIEYYTRARVYCQMQLDNNVQPDRLWLDAYQRAVENCVDCWRYVGLCERARATEEAARRYREQALSRDGRSRVAAHCST